MSPSFLIMRPWTFRKYGIFNTPQGFFANTFISKNHTLLIFEGLKDQRLLRVGGLLLLMTSPILAAVIRYLARTFTKVRSTCTLTNFCHSSYIFRIITHLLINKIFLLLLLKHSPKYYSWEMNGIWYWKFFSVECLQPYKLKKKSNFNPIY